MVWLILQKLFVLSSCTFSRLTGSGSIRVMLHLKALLTIINWTTLSNNLSSPQRAADSMSPPLPPPSMEWGSVVLILAAEATSPWPVATCLVGGGSRGGGGVALYKWSFGHQPGLSGLFNQKPTTKTKVFNVWFNHLYLLWVFLYFRSIKLYLLSCLDI